jgi:serine/threonine-protein kinase
MEQVCSALDFAHQHNVVHRDIKPANLMLTADDVVKITDFGTAKILQFGTAQTAHVMGTPSYMSPEQVKGKPVDGRSDIFSLGVILYELMTGEKPFPGQNITTVIYKIINEEPIPPRSLDSSIHPGLSAVITRALAKEPADRFQSCHELMSALKNYHEMIGPDTTVRMAPANSKPPVSLNRTPIQPPRPAAASPLHSSVQPIARSSDAEIPALPFSPIVMIEEPSSKRGGWLLTLILLGIIGFAGYRVYPQALDLWQRTHEEIETPSVKPKTEAAPAAPTADDASTKSDVQSGDAPPAQSEDPLPLSSSQPAATAPAPVKAPDPAAPVAINSDKPVAQPKPAPAAAPTPAHLLELKLRSELTDSPLLNKVTIRPTANALTLSGSMNIAEHRELMTHLHNVPPSVRIIDDIDLTGDSKAASSAPVASAGWIMVRSFPPAARILVDGRDTGLRTPSKLELQSGEHEVQLLRPGFETAHRKIAIETSQTVQFTETLSTEQNPQ